VFERVSMKPLPTLAAIGIAAALAWAPAARSTPLYSARAGRTCDNCHLEPNKWENPPLADRKCTLSCESCHVDPSGGGLRNASGRFYGRSTLAAIATSPRPTMDWDRDVLHRRRDRATTYSDSLPQGPASESERQDPRFAPHDLWAHGKPLGGSSKYAPWQGRYGAMNADPFIRIGWDVRVALLTGSGTLPFPMQIDLGAAVHPVEHVTVLANVGARGRRTGIKTVVDDPATPYLREAFLLVHEAPYRAYAKAGRFVPAFGLRIDDHTSQTRRGFELDNGVPEARVTGIEVGLNPNYPFASLSWFRGGSQTEALENWNLFDLSPGYGGALHAGLRAEGWSVGGSVLARRRPAEHGGDATSGAVFAVFNPWHYWRNLPVVLQAEFDFGTRSRSSGHETRQLAYYQEITWLAWNGIDFIAAQDWSDPDTEVRDDDAWRLSGGVQLTPFPGLTFDARGRLLVPAGEQTGADFFAQFHFWN